MTEWLYEEGIGESRSALVQAGTILEAIIELPGRLALGTVLPARLVRIFAPGRRGLVSLEGGEEAIIEPVGIGLTEGSAFRAEVVREPLAEPGRTKLARVRSTAASPGRGPTLKERIGQHRLQPAIGPDRFEESGWSELLEEAMSGEIAFQGGALRMSLTPAMTLFDVDGDLPAAELAEAGAAAAARAIRRFGIGGSIGIDLPTLSERGARQAAAAAVDSVLPQPFERTAVNGFGFLQIVRRRDRPSLPELLLADPVGASARAILRRAERCPGRGPLTIEAAGAVIDRIEGEAGWIETLRRRTGADVALHRKPGLAISAGHVHRQSP